MEAEKASNLLAYEASELLKKGQQEAAARLYHYAREVKYQDEVNGTAVNDFISQVKTELLPCR